MRPRDGLTAEQRRLLEESVNEIGLPVRTTNHLEEIGVFTIGDLLNCTREQLLAIPNFGEKTLQEVYKSLAEVGFLRPGAEPPSAPPGVSAPKPTLKIPRPFRPRASQFRRKGKHGKGGADRADS